MVIYSKVLARVHQGYGEVLTRVLPPEPSKVYIRFSAKPDDTTKPRLVNRRQKKRWRKTRQHLSKTHILKAGLRHALDYARLSKLSLDSIGRRNLICRHGEKSPQFLAAFLCPPFSLVKYLGCSIMAGLFGQRSALAAPCRSFRPHSSPPPDSVETIAGGYILLDMELPA